MSPSVLDSPPVTHPEALLTLPYPELPYEDTGSNVLQPPANWISRQILKSYLSSFNLCLNQLGWVPQSILEIGCGDGSLISYAAQTFMHAETVGVEFDEYEIAATKAGNCCRVEFIHCGEADNLPFDTNRFDLVVSHNFVSRSPIPRHWLQEMARVSAEGVIVSAVAPLGNQCLQWFPGAKKAMLAGRPVFSEAAQPVGVRQLKEWVERQGLKTESLLTPLPFTMIRARKLQKGLAI